MQKKLRSLKVSITIVALVATVFVGLPIQPVSARVFNPHNIITDDEMFNKSSLSKAAIQTFLERENSVLARYSTVLNGQVLKTSEIIWQTGQKFGVNPKFLLATLEKEQGLIHSSQATEKALDWATGYSCYGGTCKEKHQGLVNQLEATAETQKIYQQRAAEFGFRVGVATKSFDGFEVVPENQATANLFIYTPYVGYSPELGITQPYGGNRLFWRVWQRYFSNQKYLDGQVITDGTNYWFIDANKKRKFASAAIFNTDYQSSAAIRVTAKDLAAYKDGEQIYFSHGTVVRAAGSNQLFLIDEKTKRPILDETALALLSDVRLAVTGSEVPTVPDSQLAAYTVGPFITTTSLYPQGKLFKDESDSVFLLKDGIKKPVDPVVLQTKFLNQLPETVTSATLASYPLGEPVKIPDGTFVTNSSKYYLITDGERMRIEDPAIIDRVYGAAKRTGSFAISAQLLELHPAGDVIDYIDDTLTDPATPTTQPPTSYSNYGAQLNTLDTASLVMATGQTQKLTATFTNTGSTTWQPGTVWLTMTDQNAQASTFTVPAKINFSELQVARNQTATFTFDITAPADKSGLLTQQFTLQYTNGNQVTPITSIAKFIIVKPGISAEIIQHDIPVAVRNDWRPIQITMKIQNTSQDIAWTAKKTALEIYDPNGGVSPFYDPNDWLKTEVAAIPINQPTIGPGEVGEFRFTLDPRGIPKGLTVLNVKLHLLDQEKEVFLSGGSSWLREIRVD